MAYDFNAELEKDSKEHGVGGSSSMFFEFKEGNNNVVRILTPGVAFAQYWDGGRYVVAYGYDKGDPREESDTTSKSIRYALYVVDREDGKVKLAEFPFSVMKAIGDLQKNPDYSFDDIPMPYDVRITYKKDEAPAKKYVVAAVPKHTPVTEAETKELEDKMSKETPTENVDKKKERQIKADKESGVWLSLEAREKYLESITTKEEPQTARQKSNAVEPDINPDDIPF